MTFKTLSVVIPCFNEEATLEALVGQVLGADRCGLDLEIIIVDDKNVRAFIVHGEYPLIPGSDDNAS